MIDYSQWGEQKFILEFFAGIEDDGHRSFLDIGAFDGLTGSNTRALSDIGWSGLLVEASPYNFPLLYDNHRTNSKVRNLLGAFAPEPGCATFFDARGQIGTIFEGHDVGKWVERVYDVAVVTPQAIARKFGRRWDFISLDIEGAELAVIPSMGCLLEHTKLVCIEDTIPNHQFEQDYYDKVRAAWGVHGFTKVVGRTYTPDKAANTILARA